MTLAEFLKLIREKYYLIIVSVVVILAGIFIFNRQITSTYEGNIGFSLIRFGKTGAGEFNDYYATQTDNLVSTNFAKWLQSKPFTAAVYKQANIDLNKQNLDKIVKRLTVQKTSGTDIAYSFETFGKDDAQKIGEAVIAEVAARDAQIKKASSKNQLRGLEVSNQLTIHQKTTNKNLNYLLGLAAGIILGAILILISRYFRPRKKV